MNLLNVLDRHKIASGLWFTTVILSLFLLSGCNNQTPIVVPKQSNTTYIQPVISNVTLPDVEVDFINVGEGDATLIIDNDSAMLIDCGKTIEGQVVIDYIKSKNVPRLDYLIFSHMDSDHIGGCKDVMDTIPINEIVINNDTTYSDTAKVSVDDISYQKKHIAQVGDIYSLRNSNFTVIQALQSGDNNAQSIVGTYTFYNKTVLFTGDCDNLCESKLVDIVPKLEVLKVSHHGSKFATTLALLEKAKPKIAVISVGANSYDHPTQNVLDRLSQEQVGVYRTDKLGDISILLFPNTNMIK